MPPLRLPIALALATAVAAVSTAQGQGGAVPGAVDRAPGYGQATALDNPCLGPKATALDCPNLRMHPPSDLYVTDTASGRTLLHAKNSIDSRGAGPAELRGTRAPGKHFMTAVQGIHRKGSRRVHLYDTGAFLGFKHIPGQGGYWKFKDAARFEIWTLDASDNPLERVRVGPKVYYCLRDLVRTRAIEGSPPRRVYPACNRSKSTSRVTLGTSVGWSDVYPATYHEQYIEITGLTGRFGFVHIADPRNGIWESNEDDNAAMTIVALPSGRALGTRAPMPRP